MRNPFINNMFSFIGGGFAEVNDDVVRRNFTSDDLSSSQPLLSKWPILVPLFAYHRLYLITDGEATLHLANETTLKLEKNKMYLVSPFTIRSVENHSKITHFYIHFKSNSETVNPFEYYDIISPVDAGEQEYSAFRTLLETYSKKDMQSELLAQGSFSVLLSKFFPSDNATSSDHKNFFPVLDYIDQNINGKITVKQLADVLGYSEAYFSDIFSKHFKQSPMRYVTEKKMVLACRQLALSDMPIREISDYLGFDNEFYFNKAFTKSIGMPPGKWRKQYFKQHS